MLHDWPDILDLYLPGCLLQYLERWAMHQRPDLYITSTLVSRHKSDRDFPLILLHEYTTYVYTMLPAKYIQNAIFFLLAPLARPRRITFCIPSVGEKARKLKAKEAARPL